MRANKSTIQTLNATWRDLMYEQENSGYKKEMLFWIFGFLLSLTLVYKVFLFGKQQENHYVGFFKLHS